MATFSFSAEGPGELSISEGDNIELVEQVDQDWLKGRLRGQEGIFPTNFVDIIVDFPPGWKGGGGTSTSKSLASSIPGKSAYMLINQVYKRVGVSNLHDPPNIPVHTYVQL